MRFWETTWARLQSMAVGVLYATFSGNDWQLADLNQYQENDPKAHTHTLKGMSSALMYQNGFVIPLTHWGRVTHICVSKLTIIGSDNGLSPDRRQAIIRTNAGILLIGPLGINFSEISIKIHIFSFKKMCLKMSSGKWLQFCLGLNMLINYQQPAAGDSFTIMV